MRWNLTLIPRFNKTLYWLNQSLSVLPWPMLFGCASFTFIQTIWYRVRLSYLNHSGGSLNNNYISCLVICFPWRVSVTGFSHFDKSLCGAIRKYLQNIFNAMASKPCHLSYQSSTGIRKGMYISWISLNIVNCDNFLNKFRNNRSLFLFHSAPEMSNTVM